MTEPQAYMKLNYYFGLLFCFRAATEARFSGALRLPGTGLCPALTFLTAAPATVFLAPFVLNPCQFSVGCDFLCSAATALLLDRGRLTPAVQTSPAGLQ